MNIFCKIFLCLLFLIGKGIYAQEKHKDLQHIVANNYSIATPLMSDDGKWSVIRKSYEMSADTIMIFNNRLAEKPIAVKNNIESYFFVGNQNLLIKTNEQVEFFRLKKQKSTIYNGIVSMRLLKDKSQFLLHTKRKELQLYDKNATLVSSLAGVNMFFIAENGGIYAIRNREKDIQEIVLLSGNHPEVFYETSNEIEYLEVDANETGIMIYENKSPTTYQQISYLNLVNKRLYILNDILKLDFKNGLRETIKQGETYFIKLICDEIQEHNSFVDLWYGNDNKLEKKFMPESKEISFVWKPQNKEVTTLTTEEYPKIINIGDEHKYLGFDPYLLENYVNYKPAIKLCLIELQKNECQVVDTITSYLYKSKNEDYLLYSINEIWNLYEVSSSKKYSIQNKKLQAPYFSTDGLYILFEGEDGVWKYCLEEKLLYQLESFAGYSTKIINGQTEIGNYNLFTKTIEAKNSLLVRLENKELYESSYVLLKDNKVSTIIPFTKNNIEDLSFNPTLDSYIYVEENYNLPPQLVFKTLENERKIVYKSNKSDLRILTLKKDIIRYKNSEGEELKGILYYPLDYDKSKKYPMVVHIYEVQSTVSNLYPLAYYGQPDSTGFNLRLLLESGFFVYFPDIVYGKTGTGVAALDCVNHALDALGNNATIDMQKIGLIGSSHGGYQTNYIATQSDRFKAYVSGIGNSDIIRSYFSFNYNFLRPFYFQYETGQYKMKEKFSENKQLYFNNNPIYQVEKVNAPVLLWTGMKDQNIDWNQTMEFYIGLKRNNKKVIALFYPEEGHALLNKKASKDLVFRIIDWFNFFLKNTNDSDWINKEMKKDAF